MRAFFVTGWGHREGDLPLFESALRRNLEVRLFSLWTLDGDDGQFGKAFSAAVAEERPEVMIGWSAGAMIVADALARLRIDYGVDYSPKVVLISATPRFCSSREWEHGMKPSEVRALRRLLRRDTSSALDHFVTLGRPRGDSRLEILQSRVKSEAMPAMERGLRYLESADLIRDALPAGVSLLFVHGMLDKLVPWRAALNWSESLRRSPLALLPKASHDVLETDTTAVMSLISEFIR